ncbi:lysylphosphatidylglycerol synthase transmembrane domain-containing protein [Fluviicola taffensis]|uniref:lysylphosphatidylglycerol synthase transmembrane domain-containing protein n=1 Tax=Fluviicola taffensis TaxID=191579 RepID=UPI00313785F3
MSDSFEKAFSKWKIYLALFLGLSISGGILIYSFTRSEFHEVEKGTGDYIWKDTNHNKRIDYSDPEEFIAVPNGNFEQKNAYQVLSDISWNSTTFFWIFLALLGMVGRDLGYMIRIRILTKNQLTWTQSFHVIMIWEFASALAPGVMSGATVAMFILNREKIALGKATAIVILTAFLDNLFYVIIIPILFLFIPSGKLFPSAGNESMMAVFWTGFSVFALLCIVLFSSIVLYPKLVFKLLTFITRIPLLKRFQAGAAKTGNDVKTTAIEMKKEPFSFWLKAFGATVFSWSSRFLVINFIMQAFLSLGFLQQTQIFTKQFVLWMFLRISPTPGGSGVAEWAFGELLSEFSTSIVLLGTMAVLWRLISYFPYLMIGSIILPRWLARQGKKKD